MLTHRKLLAVVVIVMLFSISVIGVAVALVSGPPQIDTHTNINAPDDDSGGIDPNLWTTINGDAGGNCTISRITYLQWDLSELAPGQTIGSAAITATRSAAVGSPTSYTLGLFESADNVTNATTWNTAPVPGAQIETQPVPDTNGAQVTFDSAALVNYFQNQADGDNIATFALQLVAAGSCSGANTLVLDSIEDTSGVPASLDMRDPNSVTLSSFSADNTQPVNYALYAGLAALAVLGIGAVGYGYSRTR